MENGWKEIINCEFVSAIVDALGSVIAKWKYGQNGGVFADALCKHSNEVIREMAQRQIKKLM